MQRRKQSYPPEAAVRQSDARYEPLGLFLGAKILVIGRVYGVMLIEVRGTRFALDAALLWYLLGERA